MKIGILGSRGIPNAYGGFEQFAEYLSVGLHEKGHSVFVYNSSLHLYKQSQWKGVNIIYCNDWENKLGTAGQLIYDLNCLKDARKRNFDVLLHLGYTSDAVWHKQWPKTAVNMMNMDGLEWKRAKYGITAKLFLKWSESLVAKKADILIADSTIIQDHLLKKYKKHSAYIPYGASVFDTPNADILKKIYLQPFSYFLMIGRIEPENNMEMVIKAWLASQTRYPLCIIGNTSTRMGKYLLKKYGGTNIIFPGAVYDTETINNLRYFSSIYFHGHSVGGTNPSLLEAMACDCRVVAHNNSFNRSVLGEDADYFRKVEDIILVINTAIDENIIQKRKKSNIEKIRSVYDPQKIIDDYEKLMVQAISTKTGKSPD